MAATRLRNSARVESLTTISSASAMVRAMPQFISRSSRAFRTLTSGESSLEPVVGVRVDGHQGEVVPKLGAERLHLLDVADPVDEDHEAGLVHPGMLHRVARKLPHALDGPPGPDVLAVLLAHGVGDLADVGGVAGKALPVHLLPDQVAHAHDQDAARHGLGLPGARHAREPDDAHRRATVRP
jgi:hypothetical protein